MVDFDAFVRWAESRFGDVKIANDEVCLNSIFDPNGDDTKHKLYCNPSGGKHERPEGVYRCWLSNKIGTLVGLVMEVDHCSPEEARDAIGAGSEVSDLEEQIRDMFRGKTPAAEEPVETPPVMCLPPETYLITHLSRASRNRIRAESYLAARKIPVEGLYFCTSGDFRDRVVIPYLDRNGTLVYFNARYVGTSPKVVKYLGPDKSIGVGKGDVVYCPAYPDDGLKMYITEGEFDALTLHLCGFSAASVGGSNVTEKQVRILRPYRPVLSVDNDSAGRSALLRMAQILRANGVRKFSYVRPPVGFKDWNSLYQDKGGKAVMGYVTRCEKMFSEAEDVILMGKDI